MSERPHYTYCCRMCDKPVRRGSCRIVLVEEKRPRCRVFNGWVCEFCLLMLFAWSDTGDIEMQIGTAVLLTSPPHNLISPTMDGRGAGAVGRIQLKRSRKTPTAQTSRVEVAP